MPVSKNGRLYYTEAQYKVARKYSALEYARAAGYDLVKDGNAFHLRQHDSMIFTADGRWFWNSRGLKGRALELLQYYENRTLPEAINLLTSGDRSPPLPPIRGAQKSIELPPEPFELPEKSPTFRRLYAYLCNTRKLDVEIVQELVRQKRVYESIRQYRCASTGELRTAHNVVFVGFDEKGQPRSAFQRGTNTAAPFKRDVAGSQKKYAFCCPGRDGVTTVAVFEASIDAISHATLVKISGMDWRDKDRIALGGVAPLPLLHYLQTHPQARKVELCLDNDPAGLRATKAIAEAIQAAGHKGLHGCTITSSPPPAGGGKDWNDYLLAFRSNSGLVPHGSHVENSKQRVYHMGP